MSARENDIGTVGDGSPSKCWVCDGTRQAYGLPCAACSFVPDQKKRHRWGALCDDCEVTGCTEPCSTLTGE